MPHDHIIQYNACLQPFNRMPTRLRKDHGIEAGVPVLLSTEKPRCGLVASEEMSEPGRSPSDFQVRGCVRKPCTEEGVVGYLHVHAIPCEE